MSADQVPFIGLAVYPFENPQLSVVSKAPEAITSVFSSLVRLRLMPRLRNFRKMETVLEQMQR